MRLDKLAITAQEAFQNSMGVASDAECGGYPADSPSEGIARCR